SIVCKNGPWSSKGPSQEYNVCALDDNVKENKISIVLRKVELKAIIRFLLVILLSSFKNVKMHNINDVGKIL
ncbi:MAG: hypothetical protein O6759_06130, partial [Candidatus Dadabacteria bacterium]|nr:hypothetical protein [Candidatus Dadabacteria bacterium]